MKRFSIDESGYTGYNLLHETQPWQGACAVSINDDDARYLIKQHFPRLQASELKFSSLKRRDGNKKPIFSLLQDLLTNFSCVTCVANKRFMLTQMFIEYAVEPFYYDQGINLYEDGGNFATASMAYYVCSGLLGNGFDVILQKFQDAMRHKTPATVDSLIASVLAVDWTRLREVLGPLALRHPDCIDEIMNPQTSTDAAFIILQALISCTEKMSDEPYSIEHDRSDNLLHYNHYLTTLINCKKNAKFKASEIASIQFPLKLKNINQVDSKLSPSVQLCDVLIGLTISYIREFAENKSSSTYSSLSLYRDDQFIFFYPDTDFEQQKKIRSGSQGNELINFVAKQFHKPIG